MSELRTTDGRSAQSTWLGKSDMPEPGWTVPAGSTSRGWIGYEIPVGSEPDLLLAMRRQGEIGPLVEIEL